MNGLIRTVTILTLAISATACSVKEESRTCIYNNVEVSCDAFDKQSNETQTTTTTTTEKKSEIPTAAAQVARCIKDLALSSISQADEERLCSKSPAVAYCVSDLIKRPISQVDAERLCTEDTVLGECVADQIATASEVDAERICRK
jgi:hypothetical protein